VVVLHERLCEHSRILLLFLFHLFLSLLLLFSQLRMADCPVPHARGQVSANVGTVTAARVCSKGAPLFAVFCCGVAESIHVKVGTTRQMAQLVARAKVKLLLPSRVWSYLFVLGAGAEGSDAGRGGGRLICECMLCSCTSVVLCFGGSQSLTQKKHRNFLAVKAWQRW
jgi:hypothetical protein